MKSLGLSDILSFGKHKGEQVEDLIDDDPSYLSWLYESDSFEFDDDLVKKLEDNKII